jgi:hypothetical protein
MSNGRSIRWYIFFFLQEILDYEFLRLERLEDKDTPNIVEEIFTLYFSDSPKVIASLEQAL